MRFGILPGRSPKIGSPMFKSVMVGGVYTQCANLIMKMTLAKYLVRLSMIVGSKRC